MHPTHVVGVDPGLVHTGMVRLLFRPDDQSIDVEHEAIVGPDALAARRWIYDGALRAGNYTDPYVFIEAYRPRSHFGTDERMVEAVRVLKTELTGNVLNNTGVKKVVRRPLMELLGVWSFSTPTHHDDLRSAARIALLGMLKDEHLNHLLTSVVSDHTEGRTWGVYR